MVGVSQAVGIKLGYTLVFVAVLLVLRWVTRAVIHRFIAGHGRESARFWARQITNLATAAVFIAGVLSIWFDNPSKLVTGLGLFSAGLAFALQQVITSIAGYLLILRGDVFTIGDRIVMGGVRGDVIALGFIRTTILEMGKPSGADPHADPDIWVRARQYTGRIVTVANSAVFTDPVYNYTRDFPYLWEEIAVPVTYESDRQRAEQIMLAAAQTHGVDMTRVASEEIERMRRRYIMPATDLEPAVFMRLTDNWVELTVRFAVPALGIRKAKSDMSREILTKFDEAGIKVASSTYDVVGLPQIRLRMDQPAQPYPEAAQRTDGPTSAPSAPVPKNSQAT